MWKVVYVRGYLQGSENGRVVTIGICAVLWWPFWKWRPVEIFQCRDIIIYPHIKFWWHRTGRNFSMSGYHISLSTHISNFDDIGQCWIFVVLWRPFWKWRPVEIFQCQESIRDIINLPTSQILMISDNVEFLPPIFYAMFWQPFWKWQTFRKF
jgi:hypothetical protein